MSETVIAVGNLIIGKEYSVNSQRKGKFKMRILSVVGEWIEGEITQGVAEAISPNNVREIGESVTVRACLTTFTEANQ